MISGGAAVSMTFIWLIAMVVLLVIEGVVPGLVSIWFAAGALVALLVSLLGLPVWLQAVAFIAVSLVLLAMTRPLAKKNLRGTGAVLADGKTWTARMESPDGKAPKGTVVKALRIEGVRLIVTEK